MALADRLLVALYFAASAAPAGAMVFGAEDHRVEGALPPAEWPRLGLASASTEEFQRAFTSAFEAHRGFKGWSILADNTALYHAFRETKAGSRVRLGRGSVLFMDEDIDFYNRPPVTAEDRAALEQVADEIALAQRAMRERGRALVPVISPSKTSLYRDAVDERWVRTRPSPRPCDEVYEAYVRAFEARGVVYVDGRALLTKGPAPRELVWGPDARHWSYHGACLALGGAADARALLGVATGPHDCPVSRAAAPPEHDDYDLWRLLNASGVPPGARDVPVVAHAGRGERSPGETLFVGTSFCWTLLKDAERSGAFGAVRLLYYAKTYVTWPDGKSVDLPAHTPAWRAAVLGPDTIVLDVFETYMPGLGYAHELLSALLPELSGPPPEGRGP